MHYQKINYPDNDKVWLECYIQDSGLKLGQDLVRPALVICPGGGYVYLSPREAEPVALAYAAKGIQAFVLHYSLGWEVKGFQPLKEMDWAIGLIREHANDWYVDADKILACGFSAGGHLALSSGLLGKNRPNGLILGYPATDMSGQGSELMQMLFFGKEGTAKEEKIWLNPVQAVTKDAPPLFMFTTAEDTLTRRSTLDLVMAYEEKGCLLEYHLFQKGPHGYSLANEACADGSSQVINPHVEKWLDLSVEWIFSVFGQLEFRDISTSHIMDAIKELGIPLPQEATGKGMENA